MRFVLGALLFLSGCATTETTPTGLTLMTESQYENLIDTFTDRIETYKGLYNAVQISATIVNTPVALGQLDQKARYYQWDPAQYNAEKKAAFEKMDKQTEVFVSLYIPEKEYDDLQKKETVWRIFLDANGKRYEGKATKVKKTTVEIMSLYSYHNRFSTPYSVIFPVSTKKIENYPGKFIITGPAGSAQLNFHGVGSQTAAKEN